MEIAFPQSTADRRQALQQKAKELETAFLAEMLGHSGMYEQSQSFSGGIGEQQFASFLREAQANAIVDKGGIGLAEMIFRSLLRAEGEKGHA